MRLAPDSRILSQIRANSSAGHSPKGGACAPAISVPGKRSANSAVSLASVAGFPPSKKCRNSPAPLLALRVSNIRVGPYTRSVSLSSRLNREFTAHTNGMPSGQMRSKRPIAWPNAGSLRASAATCVLAASTAYTPTPARARSSTQATAPA